MGAPSQNPEDAVVKVNSRLRIPIDELQFSFSRSSGPGGQNVNKVNTRVTLRFDWRGSPSLTDRQRARIGSRLATRLDRNGHLRIVASRHRTQVANRRAVVERFAELLAEALRRQTPRIATRVPRGAIERRLQEKAHRSRRKRERRGRPSLDD